MVYVLHILAIIFLNVFFSIHLTQFQAGICWTLVVMRPAKYIAVKLGQP